MSAASKSAPWVFLQGLGSPFLRDLAAHVMAEGVDVIRVNFSGGDGLFGGRERQINYRGGVASLPGFYKHLLDCENIRGFVLFGDERPIHKPAIALAKQYGLDVFVVEEGYLRPNWVTFEHMGTNANSEMPRDLNQIKRLANRIEARGDGPKLPPPMQRRVLMDLYHKAGNIFLGNGYPGYKTHRPDPMQKEVKGWVSRFLRGPARQKGFEDTLARYQAEKPRYMLVPLQLNSDTQVRIHADVGGMPGFIKSILTSHAAHAPEGVRLLIKNHPLDNGVIDYLTLITEEAEALGTSDRVDFVEGGDLTAMIDASGGVVTVNSTVGLATLIRGKPLAVLGKAIYRMDGLTHAGSLDSFWTEASPPDAEGVEAFIRVLKHCMLVEGDLFTREGIASAAREAAAKLISGGPTLRSLEGRLS